MCASVHVSTGTCGVQRLWFPLGAGVAGSYEQPSVGAHFVAQAGLELQRSVDPTSPLLGRKRAKHHHAYLSHIIFIVIIYSF